MDNPAGTIREHLMAEDQEYQRLQEEHAHYDAQLEALEEKKYLSEEEQVEEVRLKKLKLRAKDRMEERIQRAMSV
ncbi:MAG: YdcH family protein [Acidobacteriota bacterium]|nr:YdcH family protein [Acidobacteriota bacterium]